MTVKHVVVIGAARSGTKILRDVLAEATGVGKVPYDIGYVWLYGNEDFPDDVIAPATVPEKNRAFIRKFVDRYAAGNPPAVIEKTVGNALRVPTVAAVFPDAAFVHLIRDGVDVIESTQRQWTEPTEMGYLLDKLRHFPARLIPRYGVRYAKSTFRQRLRHDKRIGSWGSRYPGMDHDLTTESLLTVCCRQWRESVQLATADLRSLDLPVIEVRYEQLISDPNGQVAAVAEFARLRVSPDLQASAVRTVKPGRQGTGRLALSAADLATIDAEVGDLLETLGYDRPISGNKARQ